MASVPSRQLTDAYAELEGEDTLRFGRAWGISSTYTARGGDCRREVTLRHYGTVVLRVWGERPVYAYMQSSSDRDGINGLLRLMGIGGRYRAYFNHDLAVWKDRRMGTRAKMSQVAWEMT